MSVPRALRFAWTMALLSACAVDPAVDSVVTGTPVSAIRATFTQATFSTTYTLEVKLTPVEAITVVWTGTNCGITTPDAGPVTSTDVTSTMTWTHAHPPCDPTTDHKDVKVTATITSPHLHYACTYQGADTGVGPACVKL